MTLVGSLKPNESLTQLVSGLIVVLTFTLAASVASGGGQDGARAALLGAIAANASWGIINAVLYVMDSAFDRNRQIRIGRAIASSSDEVAALAANPQRARPLPCIRNASRGPRTAIPQCSQRFDTRASAKTYRLLARRYHGCHCRVLFGARGHGPRDFAPLDHRPSLACPSHIKPARCRLPIFGWISLGKVR